MRSASLVLLAGAVSAAIFTACGSSPDAGITHYYLFATRGTASTDGDFIVTTSDPEVVRVATQELLLPEDQRHLVIKGPIDRGNGGHNAGWGWHFAPGKWSLAQQTIEECDATPRMVQDDLENWIGADFCPWSSYVLRELPTPRSD